MINILAIIPDPTDATSHYRSIGPFSHLRQDMNLNISIINGINWPVVKMHDVVFMQRPSRAGDLQIATMAKENHKPLWIDYDDNLFNIPTDNPTYPVYCNIQTRDRITTLLQMADVVTVSTPFIATIYQTLNRNIKIIPNAIDDVLIQNHQPKLSYENRKKTIMWRGSKTHDRDLMSVAHQIIQFSKEHEDFEWTFVGANPWFITDNVKNAKVDYGRDIPGYFRFLKEQQPGYFICPLAHNDFNRSKSNIAWIEATFAGAPCLAPDLEEWKMPGCLNYNHLNPDDFKIGLELMTQNLDCNSMINQSWNYIKDHLTMKKTNLIRKQILESLL